jgi:cytokinin dehydrogenase
MLSSTVPAVNSAQPRKSNMATNRRTVLRTGIAVTAAAGAAGIAIPAAAEPPESAITGDVLKKDLPPVSGELTTDPAALAAAADDFGHIVHRTPQYVLKPATVQDVVTVVAWANSQGLKVAARGQGHSTFGRPMIAGGVVIDMSTLNQIHSITSDRMVVDAGVKWSAVVDAALAQGLTPPVLTAFMELSVGGTVTVGGIGGTSHLYGMQTDNVLELNVVVADGRELVCSATQNTDLFNTVRAGLGQVGIITKATLKLMPAPARVRRYQLFYPNQAALTADQRKVLSDRRFQHIQGAFIPNGAGGWKFQLEGGVFYTGSAPDDNAVLAGLSDDRATAVIADLSYAEYLNAFDGLENILRGNGQWFNPHPWWLTFLPDSAGESLAAEILGQVTNDGVGPFGRFSYYPMTNSAFRTPMLRIPGGGVMFTFNIVRIPATKDQATIDAMVAQNRAFYERIRSAGGVLYPVSGFAMSKNDWRTHFGPKFSQLSSAKSKYDPSHIFTPGYEVF